MAPDGFEKFMLIVNGQFPGPVRTRNVSVWHEADLFRRSRVTGATRSKSRYEASSPATEQVYTGMV